MSKYKRAIVRIYEIEILCPYCEQDIVEGETYEVPERMPKYVRCDFCERLSLVPKSVAGKRWKIIAPLGFLPIEDEF